MNREDALALEKIQHEVGRCLKPDIAAGTSKMQMLTLLSNALPLINPSEAMHHDIVEKIINIAPAAGRISPVKTIEALSKAVLWVGNEYIPHFAQSILILEKPALDENVNKALCALEQSLMICYCAILPKNVHGIGRSNEVCIEWQRHTFLSILHAIEEKPFVDPEIVANVLKMSETMTSVSHELCDIHTRIISTVRLENSSTSARH